MSTEYVVGILLGTRVTIVKKTVPTLGGLEPGEEEWNK